MATTSMDEWSRGDDYEAFMGRWSRLVAGDFLSWVDHRSGLEWLDVGSGTGALAGTIAEVAEPQTVVGIDSSPAYAADAARRVVDPRVSFAVLDAQELTFDREFDVVAAGLVLPFLQPVEPVVGAMREAARHGGVVAAYVWDYGHGMELLSHYWAAAVEVDPDVADHDEAVRFGEWTADHLAVLWYEAGLGDVLTTSFDVEVRLPSFDDYWQPFLGGQGPAPSHLASLDADRRGDLRRRLRARLPIAADGSVTLGATALAVKGIR